MTVPGQMTTRAPDPVDLAAARADVARRLRWQRLTPALSLAPLAMVTALNPSLPGGLSFWRWGWLLLLGAATAVAVGLAFDHRADRRAGGPAGPGRSSWGEVVSSAPGPVLWTAVQDALGSAGFTLVTRLDAHTIQANRWYRGGRYWITVRVEGVGSDRARVTAWAHPDTGWFGGGLDHGRNRRHANAVLTAVPGVLDAVREPDTDSRA